MNHVQAELLRAKELIADPIRWCQRVFAYDDDSDEVSPDSPAARRWCASGALQAVGGGIVAHRYLFQAAGQPISVVNDNEDHSVILRVFDSAIELAGKWKAG